MPDLIANNLTLDIPQQDGAPNFYADDHIIDANDLRTSSLTFGSPDILPTVTLPIAESYSIAPDFNKPTAQEGVGGATAIYADNLRTSNLGLGNPVMNQTHGLAVGNLTIGSPVLPEISLDQTEDTLTINDFAVQVADLDDIPDLNVFFTMTADGYSIYSPDVATAPAITLSAAINGQLAATENPDQIRMRSGTTKHRPYINAPIRYRLH